MTILAFFQKNAQKCSQKWAYLKNGLSYSLVAWRGCYYQQSPPIATFTYAKGWKEKFKHVNIFKSAVSITLKEMVEIKISFINFVLHFFSGVYAHLLKYAFLMV